MAGKDNFLNGSSVLDGGVSARSGHSGTSGGSGGGGRLNNNSITSGGGTATNTATNNNDETINYYVVSACLDGSLCFYTVHVPKITPTPSSRGGGGGGGGIDNDDQMKYRCLRTQYMAMRRDFNSPIISMSGLGGKSLLLVQAYDSSYGSSGSSSGGSGSGGKEQVLAVYDVENAVLLGQLLTAEGMEAMNNPSRLAMICDVSVRKNSSGDGGGGGEGEGSGESSGSGEGESGEDSTTPATDITTTLIDYKSRAQKYSDTPHQAITNIYRYKSIINTSGSGISVVWMRQEQGKTEFVPCLAHYR